MRTMGGLRHKASSGDRPQHQVVVTAQCHRSIPFHRDWQGGPQALSKKHVPLACTTLRKQCTCQTFGSWEVACKTDLIACAGEREDSPLGSPNRSPGQAERAPPAHTPPHYKFISGVPASPAPPSGPLQGPGTRETLPFSPADPGSRGQGQEPAGTHRVL